MVAWLPKRKPRAWPRAPKNMFAGLGLARAASQAALPWAEPICTDIPLSLSRTAATTRRDSPCSGPASSILSASSRMARVSTAASVRGTSCSNSMYASQSRLTVPAFPVCAHNPHALGEVALMELQLCLRPYLPLRLLLLRHQSPPSILPAQQQATYPRAPAVPSPLPNTLLQSTKPRSHQPSPRSCFWQYAARSVCSSLSA